MSENIHRKGEEKVRQEPDAMCIDPPQSLEAELVARSLKTGQPITFSIDDFDGKITVRDYSEKR